jgi:hypothetical protein
VDTLKDIWASLVAGVQERTTNPLSFSFIASWCLWNFKFFFILAGDGTTAERLHAVDALYPFALPTYLGHAFGAPLVTAVLYVFVYPSISARVIETYRRKQVKIANTVKEIEGSRLRTVEESTRLTRDHESERTAWQEREAKFQQQLQLAREALAASEKEVTDLSTRAGPSVIVKPASAAEGSPQDVSPINLPLKKATAGTGEKILLGEGSSGAQAITQAELEIIDVLSNVPHGYTSAQIAGDTNRTHSSVVVSLETLVNKSIVQELGANKWELTPSGHRLAVKLAS